MRRKNKNKTLEFTGGVVATLSREAWDETFGKALVFTMACAACEMCIATEDCEA